MLEAKDIDRLKVELSELYGHFNDFYLKEKTVDGVPTLICRFQFLDIHYELFAQNKEPVLQTAYKHFLVEERLLKFGNSHFCKYIKNLKAQGIKTEPAFYAALNLKGDAYKELIDLQKKSNAELQKLLSFIQ